MKKKIFITVLFCLISLLAVAASASSEALVPVDPEEYVERFYHKNGSIFYADTEYEEYYIPDGYHVKPVNAFVFAQVSPDVPEYVGNTEFPDVVTTMYTGYTGNFANDIVYVSENARVYIDDFVNGGEPHSYRISNEGGTYVSDIDMNFCLSLTDPERYEKVTLTGDRRRNMVEYYFIGYDKFNFVFRYTASVFVGGNKVFVVPYEGYGTDYFYADGMISSRKDLTAFIIEGDAANEILRLINKTEYYTDGYVYQRVSPKSNDFNDAEIFFFWLSVSFTGIALPLGGLTAGVILSCRNGGRHAKRWLPLIIASSLWLIATVCVIIVIV